MGSRSFEHPLHRHPAVAPVLHLLDATPDASLGRGGPQATIVHLRALMRLDQWACERFELTATPGYADRMLASARNAIPRLAESAFLPGPLAEVHRADEHDRELTETARRAMVEGPDAARAYAAECKRPSLAARRAAEFGCWPALKPTFVGRLDADVEPQAYQPSVSLAGALAARQRWAEARQVASKLRKQDNLQAEKVIVRCQVDAGIAPRALSCVLQDEYLWHSARIAADRQNLAAALEFVGEMRNARRRAAAEHEVRARAGQLEPIPRYDAPGEHPMGEGLALLAQAEIAALAGQTAQAWDRLSAAAATPRRDGRCWIDGTRPDLRIAQQLLYLKLKHGHQRPWPWGRRRQLALLDRLDAVLPVIDRLSYCQVTEALQAGVIRAKWLQERLRQALFIRSVDRVDFESVGRHLHRAVEAEAYLRGLVGDLDFGKTLSRDPADPIRALYDDGLARSPRAARRRSGLLQAARKGLQLGLNSHPDSMEVARIRLFTMIQLGGDPVRKTLTHQLRQTSADHRLYMPMARALVRIDGRALLPKLFKSPDAFGNRFDSVQLHQALEDEHLAPRGFTQAVAELRSAVGDKTNRPLNDWWFELCEHLWTLHGALPTEGILRWMAIQPADLLQAGPIRTLDQFAVRREQMARIDQSVLIRELATDPDALTNLVMSTPFSSAYGLQWSMEHWRQLVDRVAARRRPIGHPVPDIVEDWAASRPLDVGRSLLAGHPPLEQLERPLAVEGHPRLQLRYLHKCRDILRFWRFADMVHCCFNSSHAWYRFRDAERLILQLWRDPMSFCFEILLDEQAHGFIFGGFGKTAESDALLLNGVYVRKAAGRSARAAMIDTICRVMQAPLRLQLVGVANRFGGLGPLDPDFKLKTAQVWRYRALTYTTGAAQDSIYDDISTHVNRWGDVALFWRG